MKKYLLIAAILCIIPIAAFGWGIGLICSGGAGGGSSCDSVVQSATEANPSDARSLGRYSSDRHVSTTFTASKSTTICKFTVFLIRVGDLSSRTVTAHIYDDNSGPPGSSLGNSSALDVSGVSTSGEDVEFTLSVPITNTTPYHIVLSSSAASADNYLIWRYNSSSASGHMYYSTDDAGSPNNWVEWGANEWGYFDLYE